MGLFARLWRRIAVAPAPTSEPVSPVDLATIRSLDYAVVEIRHPVTDEPLGARVTLASPDHPAHRQARLDIARARRGQPEPEDAEAMALLDETALDMLSRIVLGWSGIKLDGVDLPYSPASVRDLLAHAQLRWLVNQLLREAARGENFIKTSAID